MPEPRYFDTSTKVWVRGQPPPSSAYPPIRRGPGTILKLLLAKCGITPGGGCKCNATARQMDREGVAWCEAHFEEIVAVMTEEANRRNWLRFVPFKALGAEGLVRTAILNCNPLQ